MPRPRNLIARAYATLGVRPGATLEELRQRHRQLVKTWHPDRWATDPAGHAEAAQRMRAANEAYATLLELYPSTVNTPAPRVARPLSQDERDALVRAIGTSNPVTIGLSLFAVVVLVAIGIPAAMTDSYAILASTAVTVGLISLMAAAERRT